MPFGVVKGTWNDVPNCWFLARYPLRIVAFKIKIKNFSFDEIYTNFKNHICNQLTLKH